MTAEHKVLRAAVVAGLIAEETNAAERVYVNRDRRVFDAKEPIVLVYITDEVAEIRSASPKIYARTVDVVVTLVAEGSSTARDIDDRLDDLAEQVQAFFYRDPLLGIDWKDMNIEDTWYERRHDVIIREDQRRPTVAQQLTFKVRWLQEAPEGRCTDLEPLLGISGDVGGAKSSVDLPGATFAS